MSEKLIQEVTRVRGKFIEETYPKLFGEEEMGDPSRELTPQELTGVLVAYETALAAGGLFKVFTSGDQE